MENGFAIHPGILGTAELAHIAERLNTAAVRRSRAGARHLLAVPAIGALARDSRLMRLAADVLGAVPFPFGATLFDKSSQANWLVVWHQDTALPMCERREANGWGPWSEKGGVPYSHAPAAALEQVVALRIHLDDSTAENGPLRVLPGTHALGVLTEAQIHSQAKLVTPVECAVARGGVLAMRPLIIHASSKIATALSRRVIHFEYAATAEFAGGMHLRLP